MGEQERDCHNFLNSDSEVKGLAGYHQILHLPDNSYKKSTWFIFRLEYLILDLDVQDSSLSCYRLCNYLTRKSITNLWFNNFTFDFLYNLAFDSKLDGNYAGFH